MTEIPTIPGYRVERRLGQGGMATVYLAIQQSFEREVALKVMSPLLNSDPSFAARFKREAHIVAQLNHASIVPVFDVGEYQSYHYLSMEYLPAGDLRRRILDGPPDVNLALRVCVALSAALDIAHRRGFIHRDIKPENILFREDGTPVLTDFGIARALDRVGSMTLAGMLVGTPEYMSPEQVKGLELDGRSDLYSVGIVFYEILTGSAPFKNDSTLSIAFKQVGEPLPPLPPEYEQYQEFMNCLTAKEREERFSSGAEVVRALRLLTAGRSGRERTLVHSLTPTRGLSSAPTPGTQTSRDPAPALDETYISQRTLARPRVTDASRRSGNAPANQPEGAVADLGGTDGPLNSVAARLGEAADPRHHELAQPEVESPTGLSAAEREYVEQDSSIASNQPSRAVLAGAATAQAGARFEAKSTMGGDGAAPSDMIASAPPEAQSVTGPSLGADSLPSGARTNGVRNRQLWVAAAGVAVVIICVGLVFVAKRDAVTAASTSTQSRLNTKPAVPIRNPPALPVQTTPSPQPTGASALQHLPTEQTTAVGAPIVSPGDASGSSVKPEVLSPAKAGELAEAAAKRKLLAAERRQRKAEQARLADEAARTAQLAAQEAQIQDLLAAAKTQYKAGALWQPPGSSAADSYRAILTMQPEQAEALAGAQRLANVLADEAEDAEASGNLDSSKELVNQVQSLQPTHPKLPGLQARLQQMQTSPIALDARERGRLEKAAKYISRAEEDLRREPLDFKAVDDATDQYDKALSAAPKAPGLPSLKERLVTAYPIAVQTVLDLKDTKRAQKLIGTAHKRNWSSPELEQLEMTLQSEAARR